MTEKEVDQKLAAAFLAFSQDEAKRPPGSDRFNGTLTLWESCQLVKVVRKTLTQVNCRICEEITT